MKPVASRWWFVYLARCADGSLYCGIARDVATRIAQHDAGTGARYTRGRGPLVVVLVRRCRDQGTALRLEHAIKQLPRAQKAALAADPKRIAAIARRVLRTAAQLKRRMTSQAGSRVKVAATSRSA